MYLFNVGDRVVVREWDDMLKEFGSSGSSINTPVSFVNSMKPLIGAKATIREVKGYWGKRLITPQFDDPDFHDFVDMYSFDDGMFRLQQRIGFLYNSTKKSHATS